MENYSIISLVGKGSFGRVFKATDLDTNNIVALKVIVKKGRTKKEIKNLRGECEIQKHLSHPNIIRMLKSFETNNEIVVVTEYAQSDLHKLLSREGSIGEIRSQKLAFDLVSALYYLHSHRILHRDLKPQNILLDSEENAKLCDFGLARNMTMETHVLTSIKGTPLYMAPEIINEKPYDHQADLWSLGCILYETLAGEPPFSTNSIIRLALLIRDENIKWPSFLSSPCISFLKGLLEKEPSSRMTWTEVLSHPFVKEKIYILDEGFLDSPFTNSGTKSINVEKVIQKKETQNNSASGSTASKNAKPNPSQDATKVSISSQDSMNVILQSDIEIIDTDVEEQSLYITSVTSLNEGEIDQKKQNEQNQKEACFVSGNKNLIVNHLSDNFQCRLNIDSNLTPNLTPNKKLNRTPSKSRELEKRKLSQNLDNFSVRMGKSSNQHEIDAHKSVVKHIENNIEDNKLADSNAKSAQAKGKSPPSMLPGWDSCDEYQSPPIENEEWLAFLYRSMQEILDGELDSLKQQNLVSIIVAPLRNVKASSKVIECVAQLLSLPLVIDGPPKDMAEIRNVYIEVKLVPNLVYASKLLCANKLNGKSDNNIELRNLNVMKRDELKTLESLYELVCHLVHLNDQFLSQFCDAVVILGANPMLISFISDIHEDKISIRLANLVLSLLCCALRELPENAGLVEKIVFKSQVNIVSLLTNKDSLLKLRTCMLLRMAGRFSCCALQNIWSTEIKETLEALVYDSSESVRSEAEEVLEEFKHLSFYE